ncbi:hypothetical protein O9929_17710 [Vibrio lentus]|nr:hypothetical protein [Vibrio lentus]
MNSAEERYSPGHHLLSMTLTQNTKIGRSGVEFSITPREAGRRDDHRLERHL